MTEQNVPGDERRRDTPAATYRLQVHAGFRLEDAAEMAGYLADLGVTHAYSSPLLRSAEGSTHGYDTVDHAHIDEARGGRPGFDRFVAALHQHGLGLVLDLVPNHMGVADPAAGGAGGANSAINAPVCHGLRDALWKHANPSRPPGRRCARMFAKAPTGSRTWKNW